jgi:hypothetical protein
LANLLWGTPAAQSEVIATAALDGDTDGTLTVGSEVDNSTGTLYTHGVVEVELGSINPTGTPYVEVYTFYAIDGANYEENSVSLSHRNVTNVPITTGSSTKNSASLPFPILPYKLKVAVRNKTGQTLATGGNSVKLSRFNLVSS